MNKIISTSFRLTLGIMLALIISSCGEEKMPGNIEESTETELNTPTLPKNNAVETIDVAYAEADSLLQELDTQPIPMQGEQYKKLQRDVIEGENGMIRYEALKKLSFDRYELRKENGDTLVKPLGFYPALLPESVDGYVSKSTRASYDSVGIFLFANVSRTYENTSDPTKYIVIELHDFVEMPQRFYTEVAWAASSVEIESDTGFLRRIDSKKPHVFGLLDFQKQSRHASLRYAIAYRFDIRINANKVDNTDLVEKLAKKIDMNKLIKL